MKKIFIIAFLAIGFKGIGQIKVPAPLIRNNTADTTYGTHYDTLGYGGYMVFSDIANRNAIPYALRKIGMLAAVDTVVYQLKNGITNSDWSLFKPGGTQPPYTLTKSGLDIKLNNGLDSSVVRDSVNARDTFYLLATGQSNSSGAAYNQYVDTVGDWRVQAWDSIPKQWVRMTVGQRPFYVLSSVSAQFFLAKKIAKERNCIVRVVNYAVGGAPIDRWHDGINPQSYLKIIDTASREGNVPKYDLMVWDQGESDSYILDSTYTARWDSVKAFLRRSPYFRPTTNIVVVGLPSDYQNALPGYNLKDKLLRTFDYNTDPWDGYAPTDSLPLAADRLHFTGVSLKKLGEEIIWQTWKSLPSNFASTVKQWGYRDSTLFSLNKGNVGIGNEYPSEKLDVNGDVKLKYKLKNYRGSTILHTGDRDTTSPNFTRQSIFVGANAGNSTFQGIDNVGVGIFALNRITNASRNTAIGKAAGFNNFTGSSNINIGSNNVGGDGSNNISIGASSLAAGVFPTQLNPNDSNQLEIGTYIIGKKGNLGIGTAAPTAKLHVVGTGLFTDTLTATTMGNADSSNRVATTAFVKMNGGGGGGGGSQTDTTNKFVNTIEAVNDSTFRFNKGGTYTNISVKGATDRLTNSLNNYVTLGTSQTITASKVFNETLGIGNSPFATEKFHVTGNSLFNGEVNVRYGWNLNIKDGGYLILNGRVQYQNPSATNFSEVYNSGGTPGVSNTNIVIADGTGPTVYVENGKMGIKQSNPTAELDVNGSAKISGNITASAPTYSTGGYTSLVRNTTSGRFESVAGGGSSLDTTKIPLSGTVLGKPITGDLRFSEGTNLFFDDGLTNQNIRFGNSNGLQLDNIDTTSKTNSIVKIQTDVVQIRGNSNYLNSTSFTEGFMRGDGFLINSPNPISQGIMGAQNFSPNYGPLSYIQKIYVDSLWEKSGNDIINGNTGNVKIGGGTNNSAKLEVVSNTQGSIPAPLNDERFVGGNVLNPTKGLHVIDSISGILMRYNGTNWQKYDEFQFSRTAINIYGTFAGFATQSIQGGQHLDIANGSALSGDFTLNVSSINQDGWVFSVFNEETTYAATFTGQTVYQLNGTTVITTIPPGSHWEFRRMNGKLRKTN